MTVSRSIYNLETCPACGRGETLLTRVVIDLVEHPECREELQRQEAYEVSCPRCQTTHFRELPFVLLNLSELAPVIVACPDRVFGLDNPAQESDPLLPRVEADLESEGRWKAGPALLVPFDVLAVALQRDLESDLRAPDVAAAEVSSHLQVFAAGDRYSIFLRDVEKTLPQRKLESALRAFWTVRNADELRATIQTHPELLHEDAHNRLRAIADQATEATDELGVERARSQLRLLQRCLDDDVEAGWAEYTANAKASEVIGAEIADLWRRFQGAASPLDAARAGEQLISRSADFHLVESEAHAAFETANVYRGRADAEGSAHLERACELYDHALGLCERYPGEIEHVEELRTSVTVNYAGSVGLRALGDPSANLEKSIALQRETLRAISRDANPARWAMVHTNLGLSLIERARAEQGRAQDEEEGTSSELRQALIREAVEHFDAALTWRSFERDPLDWAFTQLNMAHAYAQGLGNDRRGELRQAIEHLDNAVRGYEAADKPGWVSDALANRANARLALARLDPEDERAAAELLAIAEVDAQRAFELVDSESGVPVGRRWLQLARVHEARYGYAPVTVAAYERCLQNLTPKSMPWLCRSAARELANLATEADDWQHAAPWWQLAAEAGLAAVQARATMSGKLAEVWANRTLIRWAAYALTRVDAPDEAVELLERGRTLQIATWFQHDVVDLSPLKESSPALYARFVDLRKRVEIGERHSTAVADPAYIEYVEQLREVIGEIRELPGLGDFLERPPLADLMLEAPNDEVLAYPLLSPWGSLWLMVSRDSRGGASVEPIPLPGITSTTAFDCMMRSDPSGADAQETIAGYLLEQSRESAGDGLDDELQSVAETLGPKLMKPLAETLERAGRESVCIIPTGLLGLLPLHALGWTEGGTARCLLDYCDVTFAPSAYIRHIALGRAHETAEFNQLLSVGNPLPQRKPLEQSEIEAVAVAELVPAVSTVQLVGEDATKAKVLAELPRASHAHLACHGAAAADPLGLEAVLVFAGDEVASAAEILELDLGGTRLVVASACETAISAGHDVLDEALSLSTVFLAAGAAGVVASLWQVDDFATRLLMTKFYETLVVAPDRPARALREAQLWLRTVSPEEVMEFVRVRRDPAGSAQSRDAAAGDWLARIRSPTSWAGFVLSGA